MTLSSFRITFLSVVAATVCSSWALVLNNSSRTLASLANDTVTLNGHSELHLTGGGDPMTGCTVHLNSVDAWVLLHAVTPSFVQSNLLSRFHVNGVAAGLGSVRIVQYANGAVVIPQGADFKPLEVFDGRNFTGSSRHLEPYADYDNDSLGIYADSIRSFILKRGWMVTVADDEDGGGASRVYIAQDSDLEIPALSSLDRKISFVRIFPWRWVGKKGSCDVNPDSLKANWHYNWSISKNSPLDWEYVAIKQQPFWPGTNQDWEARQVNHLSGFNEPDNPVEDAYQNLSPNGSTSDAVARYPELVGTGLRVGAPAVTDAGLSWLFDFMNKANSAGIRIDYVPVHYYRSQWDNNPSAAASALYNFLKSVHDTTGLPVWVTEFNNGANWTDNSHDPSTGENRAVIEAMINMMDDTSWVERYAVYSRVEWFRQTHYDDGSLTPMGAMYRDHRAPIGYQQTVPNHSDSGSSEFLFEDNTRDSSGNGNVALTYGTPGFVAGKRGRALELDGDHDYSPRHQ